MTQNGFSRLRQMPVPDLWPVIERRLDQRPARPSTRRRGPPKVALVVGALAIAGLGVAIAAVSFFGTSRHKVETSTHGFPGVGRILFVREGSSGTLAWLSPDGTVQRIGSGFLGAKLFPGFPGGGRELLAWKITNENNDYYTMSLDGSSVRHVLPPGRVVGNVPPGHDAVQVSPDGTELAYLGYVKVAPNRYRFGELFVMDLATRRARDLGRVGPFTTCCDTVVWNGTPEHALLVQGPDGQSIQGWIDEFRGVAPQRGTYLRVDDPRLVSAYARAWPGAGPPTEIAPIGWDEAASGTLLAVLLSQAGGGRPAVAILTNRSTVAFAPRDGRSNLSVTWGLDGRFVLFSYSTPSSGGETGSLYLGNASTGSLRLLTKVTRAIQPPLVEPFGGEVMFAQADGTWRFVSLKAPYRETVLHIAGLPLDWGS